jgi:hypothetical protein
VRRPPLISLLGLAVGAAGLGLDTFIHLTAGPVHHHAGFSPSEHGAHLVVLIGMVLVLAGIVFDGVRHGRDAGPVTQSTGRSSSHAIR